MGTKHGIDIEAIHSQNGTLMIEVKGEGTLNPKGQLLLNGIGRTEMEDMEEDNRKVTAVQCNYSKRLVRQESLLKSDILKDKLDSTVNQIFDAEMQLWQNDYKDE